MSTTITTSSIPEGYVVTTGPDNHEYVVPEFMVPALHHLFDGHRKKIDLDTFSRAGAVSTSRQRNTFFFYTLRHLFRYMNLILKNLAFLRMEKSWRRWFLYVMI